MTFQVADGPVQTSSDAKDKFLRLVDTGTLKTLPGLAHTGGSLIGFDDGTVAAVDPPCGPTYGGTLLDVRGAGFRSDVGGLGCRFRGYERRPMQLWPVQLWPV